MRFLVDTNVLLYAVNQDSPEHARARTALLAWLSGPTPWSLSWNVAYEFLRVATHPKIFPRPLKAEAALQFLEVILTCPVVRILSPGERHSELLTQTVREIGRLSGNLFHDLHTAVLMREHGVTEIMTADADFHRFPFLTVTDPTRG